MVNQLPFTIPTSLVGRFYFTFGTPILFVKCNHHHWLIIWITVGNMKAFHFLLVYCQLKTKLANLMNNVVTFGCWSTITTFLYSPKKVWRFPFCDNNTLIGPSYFSFYYYFPYHFTFSCLWGENGRGINSLKHYSFC